MENIKFRMNFILPAILLLYVLLWIPGQNLSFVRNPFFILGLVLFIGSLLVLWRMEIDENGITITYLIPLGRNRKLAWDDVHDMEIVAQWYPRAEFRELMITPKHGKTISFFRLGVFGYKTLCDCAMMAYQEKTLKTRGLG